jgi:hypothetical protein
VILRRAGGDVWVSRPIVMDEVAALRSRSPSTPFP